MPPTHTNSDATNTNSNDGNNTNNDSANVESKVMDSGGSLPIPTKEEKHTGNIMIDHRAAAIEEYCKRYVIYYYIIICILSK